MAMNREIKFRAWNGYRIISDEIHRIEFYQNGTWAIIGMETYNGVSNLKREYKAHCSYHNDNKAVLMQYTGLKDKNGVEIYEGDIVKSDTMHNHHSQIIFYANSWCFDVPNSGREGWCVEIKGTPSVEVIGNIYENGELLEQ